MIIQPWLEGGKLITATPENQDSNAPYGHAGWTFDGENEAIVVVTIENNANKTIFTRWLMVSTSVSKGRDVPGQKKILVPVSLCPGTRAGANVPGQNKFKFFK